MQFYGVNHQTGAALLVSLVLLLVVTLLGVSTMDSSRLEFKMASNNQNRQEAFQAAEAALVIAETRIQQDGVLDSQLRDCVSGTSTCYEDTCAGGLCFNGTFLASDTQYACALSSSNPPPEKFWRDSTLDVFNTASKHLSVQVDGMESDVKYIVEFLCYVGKDDGSVFGSGSIAEQNNGAPLFRITALAESNTGRERVALQSTYRYIP
jgi:type IV pilus assembly protein PilX